MILHPSVVEDVGADLRTPFDAFFRSFECLLRSHALVQLPLVEFRLEDAHGIFAVHQLRASLHILDQILDRLARIGILAVIAQPDRRFDLIDVLAARTARPEGIPLDVRRIDRDFDRIVDRRRHEHRRESRLPLVIGVERRQAHHAVHAVFALEVAVGVFALEFERAGLYTYLLASLIVEHLDLVSVRLAPAGVHAHEHRRPVERLRAARPDIALSTDLIVGFPGETEEDFATTLEFAKKCGFAKMHIFPYSKRKGTPAAEMPEQVDEAVKSERAARLAKVDEELHQQMLQSTVGKVEEVLFEQPVDDEHMEGLCGPYLRVVVPGTAELANTIAKVKITGIKEDFLLGELN